MTIGSFDTAHGVKDDGIARLYMNHSEKRNAMNPQMHFDMDAVLPELEADRETKVVILTGAGEASEHWRNRLLLADNKPTIAMVNGYRIGGGLTQMRCCDFAIAADEALHCLSEVNWGILPDGLVE